MKITRINCSVFFVGFFFFFCFCFFFFSYAKMILKSDKGQLQLVFGELMKIIPEMS